MEATASPTPRDNTPEYMLNLATGGEREGGREGGKNSERNKERKKAFFHSTMVIVCDRAEPEGQGEAQEEVNV